MQKLLEKEMIVMDGKSDGPGRPMLYATSQNFMDYFGIKSVTDLPQLKDLRAPQNEIGISGEAPLDDMPSEVESPELSDNFSGDVVAEHDEEAIIATDLNDEDIDPSKLPDRKKIFLESEGIADESVDQSNEVSSSGDMEDLPS